MLAVARSSARGGLPRLGPYRVPFGLSGVHTFIVRGADSHVTDSVGVTVEPFFANVQPSTYAAGPGTTLTFYGKGFAPDEIVRVYLGRTASRPGTEVAALRTTPTGRLIASSGSYTLPGKIHGSAVAFALIEAGPGAPPRFPAAVAIPSGTAVATERFVAEDSPDLFGGWIIHPEGFRAPRIVEMAKLQAWTLKPAERAP